MEPATTIIARLGGIKEVSRATGTAYTAPYRWRQPVEKGGTGGCIPQKHWTALLNLADERGVQLSVEDLFALGQSQPDKPPETAA